MLFRMCATTTIVFVPQKHATRVLSCWQMLAIEMKASGTFVSRALGFRSATFATLEASLREVDVRGYDAEVEFWNKLRTELQNAMRETNAKNTLLRLYWSAHQRFFKQLCISIKVRCCVHLGR